MISAGALWFSFFVSGGYIVDVSRFLGFSLVFYALLHPKPFMGKVEKISHRIFQRPLFFLVLFTVIVFFSYGLGGFYLRPGFGFDTGIFIQALTNAFDERGWLFLTYELSGNSFFVNHFSPYLFLLHPLSWIPYPQVYLYFLGYLSLGGAFYLLLRFFKHIHLNEKDRFSILLLLMGSPFFTGLLKFEYHEVDLLPLLYFAIFYSWYLNRFALFLFLSFFSLLVKDTVIFSFVLWGIVLTGYILFKNVRGRNETIINKDGFFRLSLKYPLTLLILGLLTYFFYFNFVKPHYSQGMTNSQYITSYFSHLGGSNLDVILSPFLKPDVFFSHVFGLSSFLYIILLLVPFLPFVMFELRPLLFLFPTLGIVLASNAIYLHRDPSNHYFGEMMAAFMIAATLGARRIQNKAWHPRFSTLILLFSIIWFFFNLQITPIRGLVKFTKEKENRAFVTEISHLPLPEKCSFVNSGVFHPFLNRFEPYEARLIPFEEQERMKCTYLFIDYNEPSSLISSKLMSHSVTILSYKNYEVRKIVE